MNENSTPQPENRRKWIFIVLALGGVLLIGALLIIAAATGIYFYTYNAGPSPRPFERPTNVRTADPSGSGNNNPTPPSSSTPTNNLVRVLRSRSRIGDFKLQNVVPTASTPTFANTIGEAKGIYVSGGRTITFTVAEYKTKAQAAVYLTRLLRERAEKGAKILDKAKVTQKGINGSFQDDKQTFYGFCTWPENKATLCHLIAGDDAAAVVEFNRALQP